MCAKDFIYGLATSYNKPEVWTKSRASEKPLVAPLAFLG